jgi:hypothetical protein
MTTQAYVLLEYKAIIFYAYKSGNSSLVEWIYEFVKPNTTKGINLKRKRALLSSPNIGIRASLAFNLIRKHGFNGAILVRNPYSRAASGFINKFVRDGDIWLNVNRGYEKCAIELMADSPKFSFIDYLNAIRSYRLNSIENRLNLHFKSQVNPVHSGLLKHLRIMKIENIASDLSEFCVENGIPYTELPRERSTSIKNTQPIDGDASDIDCFELAQRNQLPTHDQLLSRDAIALINEIYEIDFLSLGYEKRESESAFLSSPHACLEGG